MHNGISGDPTDIAELPISADAVRLGISDRPRAAAVALDLLRGIDLENPVSGITQESLAYGLLQGGAEHAAWLSRRAPTGLANDAGRVQISRTGNTIGIILDRPEARNAIDRTMRDRLHEAFTVAAVDPDVTAVRLSGTGRAFCVGADLDEFGTTRDPVIAHKIRMATLPALAIIQCDHKFEAHVQGACVGAGLEMAAFAYRLTASPDAWFQLPELAMGLIPGAGGCVSVPRRIGRRRAAAMILSGRRIGVRTALDWGLIDAIIDDPAAHHRQADVAG